MSGNRSRRKKQVAQNLRQKEARMDEQTEVEESFDPNEHNVDEVKAELEEAEEAERLRIAAAEQAGKNRKSVLAAAGVDEGVRLDASGRVLNPWESLPKGEA